MVTGWDGSGHKSLCHHPCLTARAVALGYRAKLYLKASLLRHCRKCRSSLCSPFQVLHTHMHIHTTHTYIHTYILHKHINTPHIHTLNTYTHIHAHIFIYTSHIHTPHIHIHTCTHIHAHIYTYIHTHTYIHTYTIHKCTHAHTYTPHTQHLKKEEVGWPASSYGGIMMGCAACSGLQWPPSTRQEGGEYHGSWAKGRQFRLTES